MRTILPYNSTDMERAAETAIREGMATGVPTDTLWSAEDCPVDLLPFLAWALSVDDWDAAWPEHIKRAVIAGSTQIHRLKGTPGAMRRVFKALDLGLQLSEWFEHGGDPYTFRVDVLVATRGVSASEIKMIKSAIANTKNARSWLDRLRIYITGIGTAKTASAAVMGLSIVVQPWTPTVPPAIADPKTGSAIHIAQTITTGAPQ